MGFIAGQARLGIESRIRPALLAGKAEQMSSHRHKEKLSCIQRRMLREGMLGAPNPGFMNLCSIPDSLC